MRFIILVSALASGLPALAETGDPVLAAARASYDRMPAVQIVAQIAGNCGADATVNTAVAYCTSDNTIYLTQDAATRPEAHYLIAHELGHAIQVQHGMADFALAQITARRDEEPALRGMVARQVDCLAGFLVARAGLPRTSLTAWFETDPFAGSHWGRNPLSVGPTVSIGLAARDDWFQRGQTAQTPAGCVVGELPAGPLMDSFKG